MAAAGDDVDFSKLPLQERLEHKNWKARISGYEDLIKVFDVQDEKSNEFTKYLSIIKKIPVDSNVTAQEKGLSVVSVFLERASPTISGRIASDIINGCLVKAQLSARAKTKELVPEIILMYIELEKHEIVIEEIVKSLDNKTPKVVVGSISILREALKQFGPKVIKITGLSKNLHGLLEHKDKLIRDEAKQLTIEMYRWLKDSLKPQLSSLKPVLLNELEEEFAKIKDEKPRPTRCFRSEQIVENVEEVESGDTGDGGEAEKVPDPETDPFDFYEPVEILSKIPGDFSEKVEAKKWAERKEAVESFLQLITPHPKLLPGDYGDVVKILKRLIAKDSNVVVVGVAAKCLAELAGKLRKSFHPYAHSCVLVVLEKFKEKKQNVVVPLREAIDNIMISSTMEAILEDVISALDSKNPQIRTETASFISRFCANTNPASWGNKKMLVPLVEALLKGLNYNDPAVRDASAEALGTIMKVMSEKSMTPYLGDVDALKMAKIKEYFEKAEVKYTAPAVTSQSRGGTAKVAVPRSTQSAKSSGGHQPAAPPTSSSSSSSLNETGAPSLKKPVTGISKIGVRKVAKPEAEVKQPAKGTTNSATSKTLPKMKSKTGLTSTTGTKNDPSASEGYSLPLLPVNNLKEQRLNDERTLKVLKWNFTSPREEFFIQLKEQMITANWNENLVTNCFHSNFKMHLKAVESLHDFLNEGNVEATISNSDIILKWIALRFFDTNPSVILKCLEYLIKLFQEFRSVDQKLSESEGQSFIPYLIQKSGDPKDVFRQKVHEILEIIKEIYPPTKLFTFILNGLASKNARQRSTCLDELGFLMKDYDDLGICQPTPQQAIKEIGKQIGDKDSVVRNAALNCAVVAYEKGGEKVLKWLGGSIPEKDMAMLEERIKRKRLIRANSEKTIVKPEEEKPKEIAPPSLIKMSSTSALKSQPSFERLPAKNEIFNPRTMTKTSPPNRIQEETPSERNGSASQPSRLPPSSAIKAWLMNRDIEEDDCVTPPQDPNVSRRNFNTGTITKQKPPPMSHGMNAMEIESMMRREEMREYEESHQIYQTEQVHQTPTHHAVQRFSRSGTYGLNNGSDGEESEGSVEQLLNMPDELPKRFSGGKRNSFSPRSIKTSPSAQDRGDRITTVMVSRLSSSDIKVAIDAASQVNQTLNKPDRAEQYLSDKVDQIASLCNLQHKYIIQKHIYDESVDQIDIVNLLKLLNLLLQSIFNHPSLRRLVTRDILKEIISTVICLLLDERVASLPDGPLIIKSTNQLANAIISYSDPTSMLSALIKLLQECIVGSSNPQEKSIELVMKCIWKMSRLLDHFVNDLCIDKILFDIHCFFEQFPSEFWKSAERNRNDIPMRTVKTIVFLIIKQFREDVFRHLTMIPDPEETELYSYMQKALRQVRRESASSDASHSTSVSKRSSAGVIGHTGANPTSDLTVQDEILLKSIINKLGTNNTDEGILMLNEFCKSHPQFNLQQYLNKTSSEFFTTFVLSRLAEIKAIQSRENDSNGCTKLENVKNICDLDQHELRKMVLTSMSKRPDCGSIKQELDVMLSNTFNSTQEISAPLKEDWMAFVDRTVSVCIEAFEACNRNVK
ncbi:cytoskeleton-associated protein 5-A [Tetranychus urticae]|uniref:TOG domain-containing protein n=1 Tax=Tetranychus urticae TaxID=32264 RepID=T1KEP1_TETUR|nr:cytoskeleton-associated protein 5-A [Tetranychus urticae]